MNFRPFFKSYIYVLKKGEWLVLVTSLVICFDGNFNILNANSANKKIIIFITFNQILWAHISKSSLSSQGKPAEEQVWRCMKALLKFCTIGSREVPQLVKMIGPEPSKFAGMSKRVDELVEPIMARLASVPMFWYYFEDVTNRPNIKILK